jgi:hypothetical protein
VFASDSFMVAGDVASVLIGVKAARLRVGNHTLRAIFFQSRYARKNREKHDACSNLVR